MQYNANRATPEELGGLIDILSGQAIRDEEIIKQIAEAVRIKDKDLVFELAKELVNHE